MNPRQNAGHLVDLCAAIERCQTAGILVEAREFLEDDEIRITFIARAKDMMNAVRRMGPHIQETFERLGLDPGNGNGAL